MIKNIALLTTSLSKFALKKAFIAPQYMKVLNLKPDISVQLLLILKKDSFMIPKFKDLPAKYIVLVIFTVSLIGAAIFLSLVIL